MDNKEKVLAGLKGSIESNVKAWNAAYAAKDMTAVQKADAQIVNDVKEYAEVAQALCFANLKATEKPMLEAIKQLTFTILRVKESANKDSGVITREVTKTDRQIDLLKLDEFCQRDKSPSIANDKMWQYKVQAFNQLLCLRAAQELKIDPKSIADTYYLSEKAKEIDMGKTPTSNTQILKQLQTVIDAILYEAGENGNIYKAKSQDVAFLLMLYTKKGKKALTVSTAKHTIMRNLVAEICHRIVLDAAYKLDYKQAKEAESK